MKKIISCFLIITLSCICILSLASCDTLISGSEAKTLTNDFIDAIVAEDYDKAEGMLHPDLKVDLEGFFNEIEDAYNIDFQSGIEIKQYTNINTMFYDSSIDGSSYTLTMNTQVGEKSPIFKIGIVRNDNGYGIYNINVNMPYSS